MENTNNKDTRDFTFDFVSNRIKEDNINILPVLDFIIGVEGVDGLHDKLMDLYISFSEFILRRMDAGADEADGYPLGQSWALSLVRQFCDALKEAQTTPPTVTIKRLKP